MNKIITFRSKISQQVPLSVSFSPLVTESDMLSLKYTHKATLCGTATSDHMGAVFPKKVFVFSPRGRHTEVHL